MFSQPWLVAAHPLHPNRAGTLQCACVHVCVAAHFALLQPSEVERKKLSSGAFSTFCLAALLLPAFTYIVWPLTPWFLVDAWFYIGATVFFVKALWTLLGLCGLAVVGAATLAKND